jgi:hypothetical protein
LVTGSLGGFSSESERDESSDHGLLVFDLTVLSRGERAAKNVAEDTTAREELIAKTGRMAVPVITVDDEVAVGFDRERQVGRPARLSDLRGSCPSGSGRERALVRHPGSPGELSRLRRSHDPS